VIALTSTKIPDKNADGSQTGAKRAQIKDWITETGLSSPAVKFASGGNKTRETEGA
jgi:hypothetical protein